MVSLFLLFEFEVEEELLFELLLPELVINGCSCCRRIFPKPSANSLIRINILEEKEEKIVKNKFSDGKNKK
jgi:hypothetical protein